jgi:non-specific serine/threonine protein kinase
VFRVSPLASPAVTGRAPTIEELNASPAARLFLDRAGAVAPVSLPSEAARSAVAEIARHLDGLPLALELAAARTNVLSFEQIAASIGQRFKLLTAGSRAANPRQRTLAALIDWSYDLLDDDERKLLCRLSVFRGGCTLDTASAVCADELMDEWRILDLLSSLADKSLLVVEADGSRKRYGQLETIRDYARDKLGSGDEARALAQRRTAAFAAIAEAAYAEWDTGPRPDWLSQLSPDLDNFRAALSDAVDEGTQRLLGAAMAADLGPLFMRLSLLREGIEWCRRALDTSPPPSVAARLEYILSSLHYNRGEVKAALGAAEGAVRLYAEAADERGHTRALSQLAQLSARQSRRAEAREAAADAIRRARALGDERLLAAVLQRCSVALDPSEIDLAREHFAECLGIFRSLARDDETARALIWWAQAEAEAECYSRARDLSIEALEFVGKSDSEMALKSNIAFFSLVLGDHEDAAAHARDALDLAARTRNPMMIPIVISYIAVLLHERAPERGARLLGYAESRLAALDWQQTPSEARIHDRLQQPLRVKFSGEQLDALFAEGARWNEDRAVAQALDSL